MEVVVPDGLVVERHLQRVAHPDVSEGPLLCQLDGRRCLVSERDREELHARVGFLELQRAGDRLDPRDTHLPGDINLTRPQRRDDGRLLVHLQQHELVDIGQAVARVLLVVLPVVGVPVIGDRGGADELVHHEGTGADQLVGIVERVESLRWECPDVAVVEQLPMRVRMRLRELDHQRQLVGGRYRLHGDEPGSPRVRRGLLAGKPADALLSVVVRGHVVSGQLTPIYRRLVVKEHVVAELVDIGQRIRVLPALGQVTGHDDLGPVGREVTDTAVGSPVRLANLVRHRSRNQPCAVGNPRVAMVVGSGQQHGGEGPAMLRLEHHHAGGGIFDHLFLSRHGRTDPERGHHQGES